MLTEQAGPRLERLDALKDDLGPDTEALANVTERINALEKVRTDGDPTLGISQLATKPESPSGLPLPVIMILAALAGFTLGSGGALLLELTERRIRNEDETMQPLPAAGPGPDPDPQGGVSCAAARRPAGTCCPRSGRRSERS